MEFIVPQFIEKEAKIVGPFTFKQFIFIGSAGGLTILLYFILPFPLFVILAVILLGGALALAFLKINKTSLPTHLAHLVSFMFKPKVYLWKKKTSMPKFFKREKEMVEKITEKKEGPKLKVSRGSRLDELFTKLETK